MPVTHYLLAKGNTTYFEYKTGDAPKIVEDFRIGYSIENDAATEQENDEIDFGDSIDFGDDNVSTDTPSTNNGDFVKIENEDIGGEINWDIGSDSDVKPFLNVEDSNLTNVARGEDAHPILLIAEIRNKFINELIEVCFVWAELFFKFCSLD